MAGDFFFFFNHPRVEMQIFPRAVASLSLFKAIIWEKSLPGAVAAAPRLCREDGQGCGGPSAPGWGCPAPESIARGEGEHAGSSGCAAFLRFGIRGVLNF